MKAEIGEGRGVLDDGDDVASVWGDHRRLVFNERGPLRGMNIETKRFRFGRGLPTR
jgi:hypothetical protein